MTPVVSGEKASPQPGRTKNRKNSCTSSGVLRMNSTKMLTGQVTQRLRERSATAQTSPSAKETSEP